MNKIDEKMFCFNTVIKDKDTIRRFYDLKFIMSGKHKTQHIKNLIVELGTKELLNLIEKEIELKNDKR